MRPEVEQAVTMLQSRRPDAMEHALELLQNTVFSFSMKVCGHREDAEDTMQDVLLKAVPYLPKFDSPKALAVWLYTVAKNHCLMSRRRSKFAPKEELSLEELMPDATELDHLSVMAASGQTPEAATLGAEDMERLQAAVLQLPPQYRLILVLHDMEELSTEEIARITKLSRGNVRIRLHRARLFVRKELAKGRSEVAESRSSPPHSRVDTAKATPARPAADASSSHRPGACKEMFAELSDYLDGALDESMCDELERHMAGCKPCEAFLATLKATIEQTRKVNPGRAGEHNAAELRRRVLAEFQKTMSAAK
jgi:RNA polymerase sigma-70 factor (ECF subfamily)